MSTKKQLKRIGKLTSLQLTEASESKYTILAHTCEELGEASRAMCIEDSSRLKKHKKLDEPARSECVDLTICAISLFFANGGTIEELNSIMDAKLDKWENTFISASKK
jgi:hypothetical protein